MAVQLSVIAVALAVIGLDPQSATPAVACGTDVCAPAPAAEPASERLPVDRAFPPVSGRSSDESPPEAGARDEAADQPPASRAAAPSTSDTGTDPEGGAAASGERPAAAAAATPEEDARPSRSLPRQPSTRLTAHARYARHAPALIAALPSLEDLQRLLPPSPMTRDVAAQKERIAWLDEQAGVTVAGFEAFTVDTSRNDAFADLPHYHERIRPELFIVHWTGMGYTDVDHFVSSLKPYRVQFFLDREARVFELFEDDHHKPAHARGANDFSQGVEIETGPFDGTESPLFHYTPAQIEQTVYLAVDFLRRNDLPVDETTLIGHYAADLIFSNSYYQAHRGRLGEPKVRKFDPPQELMEVIVAKAQALDAALDAS